MLLLNEAAPKRLVVSSHIAEKGSLSELLKVFLSKPPKIWIVTQKITCSILILNYLVEL